jgi:hypothetical protein
MLETKFQHLVFTWLGRFACMQVRESSGPAYVLENEAKYEYGN